MAEKPKREEPAKPAQALVVVEPFDDYRKGDQIRDPEKVRAVLNSENAGHVRTVVLT